MSTPSPDVPLAAASRAQTRAATDPRARLAHLPVPPHWVLLSVAGAVVVLVLGLAVTRTPGMLPAELGLDEELTDNQVPLLNVLTVAASHIFAPAGALAILVLSVAFLLFVRRSPVNAVAFGGIVATGWLLAGVIKVIVPEPRPNGALLDHPLMAETGNGSFPSGHTAFVAALALACWLLARGTRASLPVAIVGGAAIVGMGAARLYVSGHYLTDVIGSVLTVATAAILFAGVWNRYGLRVLQRVPLLDRLGPIPAPPRARRRR